MRPTTFLACFFTFLFIASASAQKANSAGPAPEVQFSFYHNADQQLSHLNFFEKMGAQMKIEPSSMVLESQNTDQQGFTHFKYQQTHKGLPVFGCHYFLHEKDGFVRSANGVFHPNAEASPTPNFEAVAAVALAREALKSRKYDMEKTKTSLCFIDPAFPESFTALRLAYMVDLHSIEPFAKQRYFIDARSGKIVSDFPLILQEGVPSKGKTRYYGVQDMITDHVGPQDFVLRDPTRGDGVFVYNSKTNKLFRNSSSYWDLANQSLDEVALDAHYCTEKYYDMMLGDYDWKGIDGAGGALIANVHGGAYANAFWDGYATTYGDGNCKEYGPLTTLEVVGHEFTHGMVDYTSNLIYSSESGAINESLADMFGKLLEHKVDPGHFSWVLAHSFIVVPGGLPFRVMNNPQSQGMPAFYRGQFWKDANDVHTNSAIGNLWFSMLFDGKQGTNEAGYAYNVQAIGPDKVGQIVFNTNKHYLSERSDYTDFCQYSIEVAGNLYGQGSPEQLAVTEAWKAVGLPSNTQGDYFDLSIARAGLISVPHICATLNQYYPISIMVINTGTIAYDPNSHASITFKSMNFPDRIVPLDVAIAPGDSLEITVDDWLKINKYGYLGVGATLNITDENSNNNYGVKPANIVQFDTDDLLLGGRVLDRECFQAKDQVSFYLTNNCCKALPAGSKMNIVGRNNAGFLIWTGPQIELTKELGAGETVYFYYEIPLLEEALIFSLNYASDPDLSNNSVHSVIVKSGLPITDNYLNNFEINNGIDGYLNFKIPGAPPTIPYQSSKFFAATGAYSDPGNFEHCGNPFDVFLFSTLGGINVSINACVDMSGFVDPSLELDVALFLNQLSNATNYLYSSMLQITWEGSASGQQLIYNQEEGQVKHTKIDLPPNFKGTLALNPYAESGQSAPVAANLNADDFVLIDNLRLNTGVSHKAPETRSVFLIPNPTPDEVIISTSIPMATIRVYNVAGQLIKTINTNELSYMLDMKEVPSGLYLIDVRFVDGFESAYKLVKIE